MKSQNIFTHIYESVKRGRQLVEQGKISSEILNQIIDADPTPQKKFVGWMSTQWANNNINNIDTLRSTVEEWYEFAEKRRTASTDIYHYKTFNDLQAEVEELNQQGDLQSGREAEEDYEIIRDDSDLLIMVPHTHAASRKLGLSHFAFRDCGNGQKDSTWCVTYKAPDHFVRYYFKDKATIYFVKIRSQNLQKKLTRNGFGVESFVVAILVYENTNINIWDGLDHKLSDENTQKYLQIINLR